MKISVTNDNAYWIPFILFFVVTYSQTFTCFNILYNTTTKRRPVCTENYQLHCFAADSKLQFKNYAEETSSHAQVIQLFSCFTYLLVLSHSHLSFHFRSYVYKLMTGYEVCDM